MPAHAQQPKNEGLLNKVFMSDREPPPSRKGKIQAVQLNEPPLPEPDYISKKAVDLNGKEKRALKLSRDWKNRPINPVIQKNGKVSFTYGATMPTVVCSPFMPSDVELQPGEIVNDVVVGDTARWVVNVGKSGQVGNESIHLIFKPVDAGLKTMAVIMTNRRTYHLKLVSKKDEFTPYVGFLYPEDQKAVLQAQLNKQKRQDKWQTMPVGKVDVDLAHLDFGYRVTGDAPWKPVQVYNDGTRTIIRLPESAKKTEMPVLLVEKADNQTLVNYRVRGNGYVVDGPFQKCILIAGVGSDQEKVEIERMVEK